MKSKRRPTKPNAFHGDKEIQQLQERYADQLEPGNIKQFRVLPLSAKTLKGLADMKLQKPTTIQSESIGLALQGKDIMAAAPTGSGKTLAFLIPILEHLYVNKWTRMDGIGAIVISPTRELSYQIFETLKKVGKHHDFSAGLIIGGKNLKFERKRMDQCNILICTPGRLLQHMDENPLFNASTMRIVVLDEADRCLDIGFERSLNAILENLPNDRQTLLFSATQTSTVRDFANLKLNDPIIIGSFGAQFDVKEDKKTNTAANVEDKSTSTQEKLIVPELLQQSYVVLKLEEKITMLWSFLRNHPRQKIIVFLASCKQVKYIYEIFCRLRPGISLLALYGTLHQDRRIAIYNKFLQSSNVALFATDVASRGLDFPAVSWVIQFDCPEDVTQYIHRAGRSARNCTPGESLLVLMPSEEAVMVEQLEKMQLQVRRIYIDPKKLFSPTPKIEAHLAQSQELKASAQRAFSSYIKSIFLMRNKRLFNVHKIDFDAYAKSLGLAVTPRVRFLEKFINQSQMHKTNGDSKQQITIKAKSNAFAMEESTSDDDDDAILTLKRATKQSLNIESSKNEEKDNDDSSENNTDGGKPEGNHRKNSKLLTKAALVKKIMKKKIQVGQKRRFDEMGNEIVDARKQMQSDLAKELEDNITDPTPDDGGIDLAVSMKLLSEEDKYDRQRFRELVKQRRKQKKEKLKRQLADNSSSASENEDENEEHSEDNGNGTYRLPGSVDHSEHESNSESSDSNHEKSESESDNDSNKEGFSEEPNQKRPKVIAKLSLNDVEAIAQQLLSSNS